MSTNTKIAYQLIATGTSIHGWRFRSASKDVFEDRAEAEQHIPEFECRCYDVACFEHAMPGTLVTKLIELTFHG